MNVSLSGLAASINKAPSTFTRFMNDPKHTSSLSIPTLNEVARVSGLPIPSDIVGNTSADHRSAGLTRAEEVEIMRLVVERVDQLIKTEGVKLSADKRNQIIVLLYDDLLTVAKNDPALVRSADIEPDRVLQLIKLAR